MIIQMNHNNYAKKLNYLMIHSFPNNSIKKRATLFKNARYKKIATVILLDQILIYQSVHLILKGLI